MTIDGFVSRESCYACQSCCTENGCPNPDKKWKIRKKINKETKKKDASQCRDMLLLLLLL